MTSISDFRVNIFISYAHADNAPSAGGRGWIEALREMLEMRLYQLLGRHPHIWRDPNLSGTESVTAIQFLTLKVTKPTIFIAVLSPAYINSSECMKELQEFYDYTSRTEGVQAAKSRIFKIVKSPLPESEYPLQLRGSSTYSFYEIEPSSNKIQNLIPIVGFVGYAKFVEKVEDLAQDIKELINHVETSLTSQRQVVVPNEPSRPGVVNQLDVGCLLRVFLCHASSDKPAVRSLYRRLCSDAFDPWLDEENLLPGEEWEKEIPKAVRSSDSVIVCLSHNAINKSGYLQKEIGFALDVADEQPEGTIFLIPVKLEACDVPERLRRWQWVDLFHLKNSLLVLRGKSL
jgi:hypothetical protein